METSSTSDTPVRQHTKPVIRTLSAEDIYKALSAGWADFRKAPRFGLFFGGVYAIAGMLLWLQMTVWDRPLWFLVLALAFPLIGPFAAIGCYEVSRRIELGKSLDWSEILTVIMNQRNGQIPTMAFVVLAGFMIWMWAGALLIAGFLGRVHFAVYSDLGAVLSTGNGITMLLLGTIIGGAIAFVLFAVTAVSLPLLLDRELDFVTAMATSFDTVTRNIRPMMLWAGIIVVGIFCAMIPICLGLVVVLPVLGHATWHIYRKGIAPAGSAS